jgi:hypothetical protein
MDDKKKLNFSPEISKTPAATSWQKVHSTNDETRKYPCKRSTMVLLNGSKSLRSFGSEKTFESSTTMERAFPIRTEDKSGNGRMMRKRQ